MALNHNISGKILPNHVRTDGGSSSDKLNPIKPISLLNYVAKDGRLLPMDNVTALMDIRGNGRLIRQLSRVTWTLEDIQHSGTFVRLYLDRELTEKSSPQFTNQYDILAVQPMTEKTLLHACSNLECDIITLDLSTRLPFFLKRSTLGIAIERGIFFEITYGASLRGMISKF